MRLAFLTVALFATAASSRAGCGNGSDPSSPPHELCAGKACGAECSYDPPCLNSDPPCLIASYVGQCDLEGTCQPPGSPNTCGPMVVCEGKACGESCDPCAPAACMGAVAYECDASHQCVPSVPDCAATQCSYEGKTYPSGDIFPSIDGCNTCNCMDGAVVCTLMACVPDKWYSTCGDPVCMTGGWRRDSNIPLCTTQKPGDPCTTFGAQCDVMNSDCNENLVCAATDPTWSDFGYMCPISRAKHKTDIRYLDGKQIDRLRDELLNMKLATYRYRAAGPSAPTQLGFIIDDIGGGPSVNPDRETVNLYGYTSMAVAALQAQERELAVLREEVASLRRQIEARPARKPR